LCLMQIPGASMVGGFRQWLKLGRCVRKGQHGASIWVPAGARKADSPPAGAGEDAHDAGVAGEGSGGSDRTRFVIGTVFDVSQTDEIQQPAAGLAEAA